jgi:hypothetical protein
VHEHLKVPFRIWDSPETDFAQRRPIDEHRSHSFSETVSTGLDAAHPRYFGDPLRGIRRAASQFSEPVPCQEVQISGWSQVRYSGNITYPVFSIFPRKQLKLRTNQKRIVEFTFSGLCLTFVNFHSIISRLNFFMNHSQRFV